MKKVLIVDDSINFCKSLSENLSKRKYPCVYATNVDEARNIIKSQDVGLVLLDLVLENESGLDLLRNYYNEVQNIPIIVLTGYASVDTAVEALKLGAKDYLQKPIDIGSLSSILSNHFIKEPKRTAVGFEHPVYVTQNKTVKQILAEIETLGATDMAVLITGENGTGKELIADLLHKYSKRNENQLVKLNCAAFPDNLLDNELFGHEKGAYTGADSLFRGVFESADKGTLFLDEIGDMDLNIQAKILRALQNREIKRIGGSETIKVDIRFIAATNKLLEKEIDKGKFRKDLYFRLNAATVHLPPLRERLDDIPVLCENFINEANRLYGKNVLGCADSVFEIFFNYAWPGNIRELRNTVQYAVAMSNDKTIDLKCLPKRLTEDKKDLSCLNVEENEKTLIMQALQRAYFNKKKAAEYLNISRNTLYNKMKKYGIDLS